MKTYRVYYNQRYVGDMDADSLAAAQLYAYQHIDIMEDVEEPKEFL